MTAEPVSVPPAQAEQPLRSVHTTSFPAILEQLGISLLVSTYQAGKLVLLRADGGVLNTHFRGFNVPMGVACDGERLAVGTAVEIWEFHNVPAVARKLEPAGKHDVCFLPRTSHITGNVQIHEMAWVQFPPTLGPNPPTPGPSPTAGGGEQDNKGCAPSLLAPPSPLVGEGGGGGEGEPELVFVNTRFSCLATRSTNYSFAPFWRPPFISALAPEDRCHLNGMGLRDGRVRYGTALGETDDPGGWRRNKKSGGILLDVPSGAVIARGLSMPHSPRWYAEQLWVLDSGNGGVSVADEATGQLTSVAALPGFTRGLDFCGRYAFVGLSQVRETAVFSGIAIAERPERSCGVWVVDVRSGQIVAFLKFEDALQEIFAVQVVPARFPDVINDNGALIADSFILPDPVLLDVPLPLRDPAGGLRRE